MRFDAGPNPTLYAARHAGRCRRCGGYLARALPIFKLAEGWGCYRCNLDDQVAWHLRQVRLQAEQALKDAVADRGLLDRSPDDCRQPARRIHPRGRTSKGHGRGAASEP
jgi:hypothetical protein